MEQKRKKFGIEMAPALHKRLKQIATDREVPLWSLTQEAIEQWLQGIPGQSEYQITDGTEPAIDSQQILKLYKENPLDRRIVPKDTEVNVATEKMSSERSPAEIPATRADLARVEAALKALVESLPTGRTRLGGMADAIQAAEKTTKPANRAKRVVPPRKRKHPPRAGEL